MVLLTALFILLTVGAAWFLTLAGVLAERYPSLSGFAQAGSDVFSRVFGATATACLLYVLYRFAPAARMSSRSLVIGSMTGTVLFQVAKWMFGWYVAIAQTNVEMYGALAGVTLLFVWLYYASLVFIIGAEVGWAYDQEQARADRSRLVA
jgi:membrane protein